MRSDVGELLQIAVGPCKIFHAQLELFLRAHPLGHVAGYADDEPTVFHLDGAAGPLQHPPALRRRLLPDLGGQVRVSRDELLVDGSHFRLRAAGQALRHPERTFGKQFLPRETHQPAGGFVRVEILHALRIRHKNRVGRLVHGGLQALQVLACRVSSRDVTVDHDDQPSAVRSKGPPDRLDPHLAPARTRKREFHDCGFRIVRDQRVVACLQFATDRGLALLQVDRVRSAGRSQQHADRTERANLLST